MEKYWNWTFRTLNWLFKHLFSVDFSFVSCRSGQSFDFEIWIFYASWKIAKIASDACSLNDLWRLSTCFSLFVIFNKTKNYEVYFFKHTHATSPTLTHSMVLDNFFFFPSRSGLVASVKLSMYFANLCVGFEPQRERDREREMVVMISVFRNVVSAVWITV